MQSSLSLSSNSPPINYPWKSNSIGIHLHHRNLIFKEARFSSKAPSLWSSPVTPCRYEFAEARDGGGPSMAAALPVVIRRSGRVSRYFWNGSELRLVCVDGGALGIPFPPEDGLGFSKLFRDFNSAVWDFLIPRQVPENYISYVKWKFLHRVFSSALQVLATQAMFRAIGIGYSHSLPSAAALNWVLKDGLGRLCRCIYTASLARAFDTNLKSVRLTTSVLFSLSIGVELLTPVFPQYFLLLASLANIAKQISLACYLATGSTVHRSFAISGNIGEVSAKSQIQTVCFDNLGLMLAALLNILFKDSHRLQAGLPLVVYPTFSAIDLLGIFQGLKHVHLQTLTKCRLLIILKTWIECNYVPSPKEVSREEGINFPCSKGRERWPIRIGCLNPKCQIPELSAKTLRSLTRKDFKFICMEIVLERLSRTEQQGILLCVREGASSGDIQMGLLQASYIRRALISNKWDVGVKASCSSDRVLKDWFELVEDSKLSAEQDLAELNKQMVAQGWAVDNVLLSSDEQARYSFLDE